MMTMKKRLGQLKFIATMFHKAMAEFDKVMGKESIQTIFRLMGEDVGISVEKRLREKYEIDIWTPQLIAEKLISDVLDPVLGEDGAELNVKGNTIDVILKVCPFDKAGIDISNKYYCTYTEGMIETAIKSALKNIEFQTVKLRAIDKCDCQFKLEIKE
jgi:hypothetical protein